MWLTVITRDTWSTLGLNTAHYPKTCWQSCTPALLPFPYLLSACSASSTGGPQLWQELEASLARLGCLGSDPLLYESHSRSAAEGPGESKDHVSQFYNKIPTPLANHWSSKAYSFLLNQQLKMPVPWAIRWYELQLGLMLLIIARTEKTGRAVCDGLWYWAGSLDC